VFVPAGAGIMCTYALSGTVCSCACTHGKAFVQVARWDCDQAGSQTVTADVDPSQINRAVLCNIVLIKDYTIQLNQLC
jgi:hypothetical protein